MVTKSTSLDESPDDELSDVRYRLAQIVTQLSSLGENVAAAHAQMALDKIAGNLRNG